MRMADEPEGAQGAVGQDPGGRRLGEEPEQGVARRAVPAVDAVTDGHRAPRQPEHVPPAGGDPIWPERPGVVVSGDEQVELASRAHQLRRDRLASDQITEAPALVDPGRRHGAEHSQELVMPAVHIGTNADPHTEHHCGFFRLNAVGGSSIGTPLPAQSSRRRAALVSRYAFGGDRWRLTATLQAAGVGQLAWPDATTLQALVECLPAHPDRPAQGFEPAILDEAVDRAGG